VAETRWVEVWYAVRLPLANCRPFRPRPPLPFSSGIGRGVDRTGIAIRNAFALTAYGVMHPGPRAWLSRSRSVQGRATRDTRDTGGHLCPGARVRGGPPVTQALHLVGFIGDAMHTTTTRAHHLHTYIHVHKPIFLEIPFFSPVSQLFTKSSRHFDDEEAGTRRGKNRLIDFLPRWLFYLTHPFGPPSALPPLSRRDSPLVLIGSSSRLAR
jgi:hypothetical protein